MASTIQSYFVRPAVGHTAEVITALAAIPGCDVFPAEDRPVLVLVTETADRNAQRKLEGELETMQNIAYLALVSGWTDEDPRTALADWS